MQKVKPYVFVLFAIILTIVGAYFIISVTLNPIQGSKDPWIYVPNNNLFESNQIAGIQSQPMMSSSISTIGFSTGGAKDIGNFRANLDNNFLPLPTDVTYEGLFYDYYFDTGEKEVCANLFCPSYNYAISSDPFSKEKEYYLSVGLNSGIKQSDFKRKKLNLVIVLDISGSMSSSFDSYYYDQFGVQHALDENSQEPGKTKLQVANESIVSLLDHLTDGDRFGFVVFDDQAYLAMPLSLVNDANMEKIKEHILELEPQNGTNLSAGMQAGLELFKEYTNNNSAEYENRIIFLTDAMPNMGDASENGLLDLAKQSSTNSKIYATFIGIGVDFNTELIEILTKIRGANYYSVHSAVQFKERMDDGFDYMVTPLVFNANLVLEPQGFAIEKVFGSPEANEATGEIMKINTLFPSKKVETETRGGMVLLKLKKVNNVDSSKLTLKVTFEDRKGEIQEVKSLIELNESGTEFFENTGIQKAILLTRYARLLKNWLKDERLSYDQNQLVKPTIDLDTGIRLPDEESILGKWERRSITLRVSEHYKQLFVKFRNYFAQELNQISDNALAQELKILDKLSVYG